MSLKDPNIITSLALKYLKSLVYKNNTSLHTVKSYLTDLNQFIALNSHEKLVINTKSDPPIFHIERVQSSFTLNSKITSKEQLEESAPMNALISQALKLWSELSPATRNRKSACLKSFFKWLLKENQTFLHFSDQVHCPKVPQKIPNFLTIDEALSLFDCLNKARDTKNINRDKTLIYLLYSGGLRVSEGCSLKWRDVNFDTETLRVNGKGGRERLVTPANSCFDQLKQMDQSTEYVFGHTPLNTRTAYSIVRSWGQKAGIIRPLSPHALRHSFATHLLTSGANLRVLQDLLGHTSLTATERYTHITTDELQKTLNSHHPFGKK